MSVCNRMSAGLVAALACCLVHGSAYGQPVLVYDENTDDQVVQQACTLLGISCTVTGELDFLTVLQAGDHPIVAMDLPGIRPDGAWLPVLQSHVEQGGCLLFTHWHRDDAEQVAAFTGVVLGATHDPLDLYDWSNSSFFSSPYPVPGPPLVWVDDGWADNGFRLTAVPPAIAVGGFAASPTDGQAAIVVGNEGRTIFNGFLFDDYGPTDANSDGIDDAVALAANQLAYLVDLEECSESIAGRTPIAAPTLGVFSTLVLVALLGATSLRAIRRQQVV